MFQIEKSVPVPATRVNAVYPFAQMAVGDSFLVPSDQAKAASVRACASAYSKRNGVKFVCKKTDDGIRVWRTA